MDLVERIINGENWRTKDNIHQIVKDFPRIFNDLEGHNFATFGRRFIKIINNDINNYLQGRISTLDYASESDDFLMDIYDATENIMDFESQKYDETFGYVKGAIGLNLMTGNILLGHLEKLFDNSGVDFFYKAAIIVPWEFYDGEENQLLFDLSLKIEHHALKKLYLEEPSDSVMLADYAALYNRLAFNVQVSSNVRNQESVLGSLKRFGGYHLDLPEYANMHWEEVNDITIDLLREL